MAAKVQEQLEGQTAQTEQKDNAGRPARQPLDWKLILLSGLAMGFGWTALYLSGTQLSFLAGIVPIFIGFYLGKRVKERTFLTSALVAAIGLVVALALLAGWTYTSLPSVDENGQSIPRHIVLLNGVVGAVIVFPFVIYGAFISQRSKQQREQHQSQLKRRGGRLENPGRVRDLDDLRGLPLPKFATYVVKLFQKNGFKLEDYAFDNKDNLVDLYMTHEEQRWMLRCTVADKVRPGVVQEFAQKMRDEEIKKGVVLTSTEFTDNARRWADNRRDLVVIDGEALMQMAES